MDIYLNSSDYKPKNELIVLNMKDLKNLINKTISKDWVYSQEVNKLSTVPWAMKRMGLMQDFTLSYEYKRLIDGVCSIWKEGQEFFTLSDLHKFLTGSRNLTPKQIEEYDKKLFECSRTMLIIDAESEYGGILLPLEKGTALVNDTNEKTVYKITSYPIILKYAEAWSQILPVNKTVMHVIPRNIKDIGTYLIEIVAQARVKGGKGKITLEKIFDKVRKPRQSNDRQRIKNSIIKLLNEWKGLEFINDWEIVKENNMVKGFFLKIPKEPKKEEIKDLDDLY